MFRFLLQIFAAFIVVSQPAIGVDALRTISFRRDIAPILQRRCAACHCEESAKGGYRLDRFELLGKPGDSGDEAVVPGNAKASSIFNLLVAKDADDRMPQKAEALPPEEISLLEAWLNSGANFDGGDPAQPLVALVREQHLRKAPATYPQGIPITALAFNGDGKLLATSGYREVLVRDSVSGALIQRIGGMPERIISLAWHPEHNRLAIGGGTPGQWGTVGIVDMTNGNAVRLLADLPEVVLSVAFAPDGAHLVAGCGDRTMRIFDMATGKEKRVLRQHADWVQSVAFNPSGTMLVSASRDRTAVVFSTAKWEQEATFREHDTGIAAAAFTLDGTRVYTSSHGRVIAWQPDKATSKGTAIATGTLARQLISGPFGVAAGCDDGGIRIFSREGTTPSATLREQHDAVGALSVSPDGSVLASGTSDGKIIFWNTSSWVPTLRVDGKP